jgi:DNA polymerase-4
MPAAQALRLCPNLILVSSHHAEYGEISDRLYRRMLELAPVVERASIDEMYMDFTGCEGLYGHDLPGFIRTLQKIVREEFALPCSIALAANKTVAKIAVGTVKPSGICVVPPGGEKQFLAPLSVDVIPGVGPRTSEILKRKGLKLVADLQALTPGQCTAFLGAHGDWIFRAANGEGNDLVDPVYARKSMSREETFPHDIADPAELEQILFALVEDVCFSLRAHGWKAATIGLKLRYADFKTITRAKTTEPTDDDPVIFREVRELFRKAYDRGHAVRLLGVHLTQFDEGEQLQLDLSPRSLKREQILHALDEIKEKYGEKAIHFGGA